MMLKIKYTFENFDTETVEMIHTIEEVECMNGGFKKYVESFLKEIEFGRIKKIHREIL